MDQYEYTVTYIYIYIYLAQYVSGFFLHGRIRTPASFDFSISDSVYRKVINGDKNIV